jgi:hypothetical protein
MRHYPLPCQRLFDRKLQESATRFERERSCARLSYTPRSRMLMIADTRGRLWCCSWNFIRIFSRLTPSLSSPARNQVTLHPKWRFLITRRSHFWPQPSTFTPSGVCGAQFSPKNSKKIFSKWIYFDLIRIFYFFLMTSFACQELICILTGDNALPNGWSKMMSVRVDRLIERERFVDSLIPSSSSSEDSADDSIGPMAGHVITEIILKN